MSFTAWITTDRSCLFTDLADVVILANDEAGNSTGDPIWSATTTQRYDGDSEVICNEARELLAAAGWTEVGGLDATAVGSGYVIDVEQG
jgi:hypothetical protein